MSNVSITLRCNRGCSYCFAADLMNEAPRATAFMAMAEFDAALDFLERSGVGCVTILGGEPTIHPMFEEMVGRARGRGFTVLVLSGGIIPERALRFLEAADAEDISVMLNVAPPGGEFSPREESKQAEVMRRLGPRVALGLNIDGPAVGLDFLLDRIEEYGLARVVRLGLAHPVVGGAGGFLRPSDYAAVGRRVAAFARKARGAGVHIEFDCGWVPCMFPEGSLAELGITPQQVGLRCNPILDILPGREVIHCYPLAKLAREPLPPDADGRQLAAQFGEKAAPYRPMMLFKQCATCDWLARGECTGGCVAGAMRRMQAPVRSGAPVQIEKRWRV